MKKSKIMTSFLIATLSMTMLLVGCTKETVEEPKSNVEIVNEVSDMSESLTDLIDKYDDGNGVHTDLTEEMDLPSLNSIPEYSGTAYVELNNNIPYIQISEPEDGKEYGEFELYSALDDLGRCTSTFVCIKADHMPTEERGPIGSVKPTGWHTIKYNDLIDGNYLYNRCHLIGYQLTGQNANPCNLITGTRYLNVIGMLPFENQIADFMKANPDTHVLYRVEPLFKDDELVARGILMQAKSLEDNGEGLSFCVFCYNVQPGIEIDYATGDSKENPDIVANDYDYNSSEVIDEDNVSELEADTSVTEVAEDVENIYIVNATNGTVHKYDCPNLPATQNRHEFASYDEAIAESINIHGEEKLCGNCMK